MLVTVILHTWWNKWNLRITSLLMTGLLKVEGLIQLIPSECFVYGSISLD